MNALLFAMTFIIQTHVPTATVSGDVVTVNADFAYIDHAVGGHAKIADLRVDLVRVNRHLEHTDKRIDKDC